VHRRLGHVASQVQVVSGHASGMAVRWKIELVVETDDEDEIERLTNSIEKLACDVPTTDDDHTCRLPWFLTTSALDEVEAGTWRDELNR
jgi:hypothetical protein